jgi:hypothetical protein
VILTVASAHWRLGHRSIRGAEHCGVTFEHLRALEDAFVVLVEADE